MLIPGVTPSRKRGNGIDRRKFLGQAVAATAVAAGALASPTTTPARSGNGQNFPNTPHLDTTDNARVLEAFETRVAAAVREASIPVPPHTTNGDEALYLDKSGTYSKALLQDTYAVVKSRCLSILQDCAQHRQFLRLRQNHHGWIAHAERSARSICLRPHGYGRGPVWQRTFARQSGACRPCSPSACRR